MPSNQLKAKKRGHKGPVNTTVGMMVKAIGSAKLSDMLDALEDGDDCLEGVFYSRTNPSPVTFTDVDHIRKKIEYGIHFGLLQPETFRR